MVKCFFCHVNNISAILWTGSDLRGAGPKYVPCKTRSVLLYVLEHQRVDNSSAGPTREKLVQLVDPDLGGQFIGTFKREYMEKITHMSKDTDKLS